MPVATGQPGARGGDATVTVRAARADDAGRLCALVAELGFHVDETRLAANLAALEGAGAAPLVAESGGVIGCITSHVMPVLHRATPVGRVSMLVVTQAWRGRGVGTALLDAALARLRRQGCGLCEVTSNDALVRAHAFYERAGFKRTSIRLVRDIPR